MSDLFTHIQGICPTLSIMAMKPRQKLNLVLVNWTIHDGAEFARIFNTDSRLYEDISIFYRLMNGHKEPGENFYRIIPTILMPESIVLTSEILLTASAVNICLLSESVTEPLRLLYPSDISLEQV